MMSVGRDKIYLFLDYPHTNTLDLRVLGKPEENVIKICHYVRGRFAYL